MAVYGRGIRRHFIGARRAANDPWPGFLDLPGHAEAPFFRSDSAGFAWTAGCNYAGAGNNFCSGIGTGGANRLPVRVL